MVLDKWFMMWKRSSTCTAWPARSATTFRYGFHRSKHTKRNAALRGAPSPSKKPCRVLALRSRPIHSSRLHTQPPGRWELLDRAGNVVGRLAGGFDPPSGMRCRSAAVLAVVAWSRDASDPKYHDGIRCESWEVVVPELVFGPQG